MKKLIFALALAILSLALVGCQGKTTTNHDQTFTWSSGELASCQAIGHRIADVDVFLVRSGKRLPCPLVTYAGWQEYFDMPLALK